MSQIVPRILCTLNTLLNVVIQQREKNEVKKNEVKKNAVIIASLFVSLFLSVHNWRNGTSNHILVTNAPRMQDYMKADP